MPDSKSVVEDSQTVEVGGVHTGDEADLARMGYKQELKCVQLMHLRLLRFMALPLTTRRHLNVFQVRRLRKDHVFYSL